MRPTTAGPDHCDPHEATLGRGSLGLRNEPDPRHRRDRLHRPPAGAGPDGGRARRPGDDPPPRRRTTARATPCAATWATRTRSTGARRRRDRLLPGALARRRRLRAQGRRGGPCLRSRSSRPRGSPDRLHGRPRATTTRSSRRTCARDARSRACWPMRVCRSRSCARRSWSGTAASRGRSPASWSRTCPRWWSRAGPPPGRNRSPSMTWSATSSASPDVDEAISRVFEIGGPDQLTYVEMLRVAADDRHRPQRADRRGPGADAAPVVVLAGTGDRRRHHHRPQPDRLDGRRGRGHRPLHPRRRARGADDLRGVGPSRTRGAPRQSRMAGRA